MKYVYAALLLHSAGKEINEHNVSSVVAASGDKADPAQVKALIASLEGVDIEEAIKKAAAAPVAVASAAPEGKEAKKEEPEEDEGKKAEQAGEGLAALFG